MTAFDTAWALLKTDMRLPRPHDVPKYTDSHANLATYGSKNPYWQQYPNTNFETFDDSKAGMEGFTQSLRDEIDRRTGKLIEPADSPWKYDVGDFGEDLKDGEESDGFVTPKTAGVNQVYDEIERASVVEAMNDAGVYEESEIERVLDEWYHAEGLGSMSLREQGKSRRMGNDKGRQINRLEDFHA
tara:strand:+ start:1309 stop:1866 length:558 start_codon:yes stop_codon:yes gene_type:complete